MKNKIEPGFVTQFGNEHGAMIDVAMVSLYHEVSTLTYSFYQLIQ
jgi:hypothetical protein